MDKKSELELRLSTGGVLLWAIITGFIHTYQPQLLSNTVFTYALLGILWGFSGDIIYVMARKLRIIQTPVINFIVFALGTPRNIAHSIDAPYPAKALLAAVIGALFGALVGFITIGIPTGAFYRLVPIH